jgi:uncharacterized membrane protein
MDAYLIKDLMRAGLEIFVDYAPLVGWNTFLAIIPLYLSIFLFRQDLTLPGMAWLRRATEGRNHPQQRSQRRSVIWWVGFAVFVAFLPNAPYILTDIIHLNRAVMEYNSMWVTAFILFPFYLVFLGIGLWAYVLSLMNFGRYLQRRGLGRYVLQMELIMHGLCSIGVFVGRFPRLNSWYIVTQPFRVVRTLTHTLLSLEAVIGILVGFAVLAILYAPAKEVTLALEQYRKNRSFSVVVE